MRCNCSFRVKALNSDNNCICNCNHFNSARDAQSLDKIEENPNSPETAAVNLEPGNGHSILVGSYFPAVCICVLQGTTMGNIYEPRTGLAKQTERILISWCNFTYCVKRVVRGQIAYSMGSTLKLGIRVVCARKWPRPARLSIGGHDLNNRAICASNHEENA